MKHLKEVIVLLTVFVFFGCEKKISEEEFEQTIFDQLFIQVVDSTYIDQRLYSCFPEQGKPISDTNGKWIGRDTVGQHQHDLQCEIKRAALKKDTLDLIIAIENNGLINEKTDLGKYKNPKFSFKHLSEYPVGKDLEYTNWKNRYVKFAGAMSFSKIKFDAKKETGSLNVVYRCGGKCGKDYVVYLKKTNDKWIISKVEKTLIL